MTPFEWLIFVLITFTGGLVVAITAPSKRKVLKSLGVGVCCGMCVFAGDFAAERSHDDELFRVRHEGYQEGYDDGAKALFRGLSGRDAEIQITNDAP